jgi:hypothetical protein
VEKCAVSVLPVALSGCSCVASVRKRLRTSSNGAPASSPSVAYAASDAPVMLSHQPGTLFARCALLRSSLPAALSGGWTSLRHDSSTRWLHLIGWRLLQ